MKQSQFYYLLRRGLLKSMSVVKEGLVMFNKFTTAGISHPSSGSAEFDGSDYILTNDLGGEYVGSFACWFYSDTAISTSNAGSLIDFNSSDGEMFVHFGSITGALTNEVITILDSWRVGVTGITIAAGWHHLAFTQTHDGSSSTYKIYLDGSEQTITTSGTPQRLTLEKVTIAGWNASGTINSNRFDGNLANVAIWNRALSSDEINAVMWKGYQSLTDNEKSGLQAWYSLDDVASPAASLATMEALAVDKDATIENKAAITAAINALS